MEPTRRTVLVAGAVSLVGACTRGSDPRPAAVDPDVALTAAAVDREQQLVAGYDAVLAAVPALTGRLAPLRAEHLEHLTALRATLPTGSPASGTPAPSPARLAPPQALRQLAALERAAAAAHAAAAITASRRLAPVLASLAASESSHLVAL